MDAGTPSHTFVPPDIRSALYVPANRADFLAKVDRSQADAVILDLEDSVPVAERASAVRSVRDWMRSRGVGSGPVVFMRMWTAGEQELASQLSVLLHPEVRAVQIPKVSTPDQVRAADRALCYAEGRQGLAHGQTLIWPLLEMAAGMRLAYEVATASARVAYLGGGTSKDGDIAAAIGFQWTPSEMETFFLRSKILLDARAAGVHNPMSGIVTSVRDVDQVRYLAEQSRDLGYEGMMCIHPSHVEVINAMFTPDAEARAAATRVLDALERLERDGKASGQVDGYMVDLAMRARAERIIARYERWAPSS